MMRALWTASSGMAAQQFNLDTISNNLANVNTTGFKKNRVEFSDLLYETLQRGAPKDVDGKPVNIQVGHGVKFSATSKIYTVGNINQTTDPLDIAIDGDGFFKVLDGTGGSAYTRDGGLKLSINGDIANLVTSGGYLLQGSDGTIELPAAATDINISNNGTISYKDATGTTIEAGKLGIYRFANPPGLENVGENLVKETPVSGVATDTQNDGSGGKILQGYLEMSNVQVVEEMVKLIQAQRAYEVNSKSIQTADEMLQTANNMRR